MVAFEWPSLRRALKLPMFHDNPLLVQGWRPRGHNAVQVLLLLDNLIATTPRYE